MGNAIYGTYATVDPSVNSMGVAIWKKSVWKELYPPLETYLVTPPDLSASFEVRARQQAWQLRKIVDQWDSEKLWIEEPQYWSGTQKGLAAANAGSLIKLSMSIGALMGAMSSTVETDLVPVNAWKGQLPKEVVISRVKRLLGKEACKNFKKDIWDATGIGLYLKGHLNRK